MPPLARGIVERPLGETDLDRVWAIDRGEQIDGLYTVVQGRLQRGTRNIQVPGWPPGEREAYAPLLRACWQRGGWCRGLFAADRLVAAAFVDTVWRGRRQDQLQLEFLHVDRAHRGRGLGRHLFTGAAAAARARGAHQLYVSATPSLHTVDFYLAAGCRLAREPDPELFALEPADIHLIFGL